MSLSTARPALPPAPIDIQRRVEHQGIVWIDFVYPGVEQINYLRDCFHFHPLHLEDVLSRLQRPKIDDEADQEYVFLVLHLPVFNEVTRLSSVSEVDIFAGRDYIVTAHDRRLKALTRLVARAEDERGRAELMGRDVGYLLYRIIEALLNACFPMLYRLDEKLDRVEADIFKPDVRDTLQELSYLRRDIMSLRRIIRPNLPVVRSLEARERPFLRVDEGAYFGDLVDGFSRVWDMLEEQKEIIEGLDATLASVTSYRINQEMKVFTLISVILLPMTLVASVLGMNVLIPFADHPLALPVTVLLMLGLAGGLFMYFRHKHWV